LKAKTGKDAGANNVGDNDGRRRDEADRDFTRRDSATVGIFRSTIPKLSGVANSFEAELESIIGERVFCHSERSEESLIICFGGARKQ
jgi:hypothetical protein